MTTKKKDLPSRRDLLRRRFEPELEETIDRHPAATRQLLDAAHA